MDEERVELVAEIQAAMREVMRESLESGEKHANVGSQAQRWLCGLVEVALRHRFQGNNRSLPLWNFVEQLELSAGVRAHRSIPAPALLERVRSLSRVTTSDGRLRAYMRILLNEGCLAETLALWGAADELVRIWYAPNALLATEDDRLLLVNLLRGLESLTFALSVDDESLDSQEMPSVAALPRLRVQAGHASFDAKVRQKSRSSKRVASFDDPAPSPVRDISASRPAVIRGGYESSGSSLSGSPVVDSPAEVWATSRSSAPVIGGSSTPPVSAVDVWSRTEGTPSQTTFGDDQTMQPTPRTTSLPEPEAVDESTLSPAPGTFGDEERSPPKPSSTDSIYALHSPPHTSAFDDEDDEGVEVFEPTTPAAAALSEEVRRVSPQKGEEEDLAFTSFSKSAADSEEAEEEAEENVRPSFEEPVVLLAENPTADSPPEPARIESHAISPQENESVPQEKSLSALSPLESMRQELERMKREMEREQREAEAREAQERQAREEEERQLQEMLEVKRQLEQLKAQRAQQLAAAEEEARRKAETARLRAQVEAELRQSQEELRASPTTMTNNSTSSLSPSPSPSPSLLSISTANSEIPSTTRLEMVAPTDSNSNSLSTSTTRLMAASSSSMVPGKEEAPLTLTLEEEVVIDARPPPMVRATLPATVGSSPPTSSGGDGPVGSPPSSITMAEGERLLVKPLPSRSRAGDLVGSSPVSSSSAAVSSAELHRLLNSDISRVDPSWKVDPPAFSTPSSKKEPKELSSKELSSTPPTNHAQLRPPQAGVGSPSPVVWNPPAATHPPGKTSSPLSGGSPVTSQTTSPANSRRKGGYVNPLASPAPMLQLRPTIFDVPPSSSASAAGSSPLSGGFLESKRAEILEQAERQQRLAEIQQKLDEHMRIREERKRLLGKASGEEVDGVERELLVNEARRLKILEDDRQREVAYLQGQLNERDAFRERNKVEAARELQAERDRLRADRESRRAELLGTQAREREVERHASSAGASLQPTEYQVPEDGRDLLLSCIQGWHAAADRMGQGADRPSLSPAAMAVADLPSVQGNSASLSLSSVPNFADSSSASSAPSTTPSAVSNASNASGLGKYDYVVDEKYAAFLAWEPDSMGGSGKMQRRTAQDSPMEGRHSKGAVNTFSGPKKQLYFHIQVKGSAEDQGNRCAGCNAVMQSSFFSGPRYCEYTGKWYCTTCHVKDSMVIPARVIHEWDFSQYRVCKFAKDFLVEIYEDPALNVNVLNRKIFNLVPQLMEAKILRTQLFFMKDFILTCKMKTRLLSVVPTSRRYLIFDPDVYSMRDLVEVNSLEFVPRVRSIAETFVVHIMGCELCKAKGSYCELCTSSTIPSMHLPIFPFQLRTTVQCENCKQLFHRVCFKPDACPKCRRNLTRK